MSALALVMKQQGWAVSGSDLRENGRTVELRRRGVQVFIGHRETNLNGAEEIVYSSAIPRDNVELRAARGRELKIFPRLALVGRLMDENYSIGITGTHGKSTTASLIAFLLVRAGWQPTYLLGASCPALGGNARLGSGKYLVAEVDESDGRFTALQPDLAVITNIGSDHLNNYGSIARLKEGFARFAARAGQLILNADDPGSQGLIAQMERGGVRPLLFGIEGRDADLRAERVRFRKFHTYFQLSFRGRQLGEIGVPAPGLHNVYNTLAALLAGWWLGLDFPAMGVALVDFRLPERRFQILKQNGITIVDDYAHLPEEIAAGLAAVRHGWRPRRVIALFQPHRFSRVKYINGRFSRSFGLADLVLLTEIYPAGERPLPGVTAGLIHETLAHENKPSLFFTSHDEIVDFLKRELRPGDFLISFSAGDLWRVTHRLASQL